MTYNYSVGLTLLETGIKESIFISDIFISAILTVLILAIVSGMRIGDWKVLALPVTVILQLFFGINAHYLQWILSSIIFVVTIFSRQQLSGILSAISKKGTASRLKRSLTEGRYDTHRKLKEVKEKRKLKRFSKEFQESMARNVAHGKFSKALDTYNKQANPMLSLFDKNLEKSISTMYPDSPERQKPQRSTSQTRKERREKLGFFNVFNPSLGKSYTPTREGLRNPRQLTSEERRIARGIGLGQLWEKKPREKKPKYRDPNQQRIKQRQKWALLEKRKSGPNFNIHKGTREFFSIKRPKSSMIKQNEKRKRKNFRRLFE